ncbi:MAG: hypothetical protein P4M11_15315 [Candidatus Pacebacteria bacterium]|nr:hypothetical protein [Candidatus Paceibacterota bacterium]
MLCYSCAQPESTICYVCEKPLTKMVRVPDSNNVFECEHPGCCKFFVNYNKLQEHQAADHPSTTNYYKTSGSYMPGAMLKLPPTNSS